MTDVLINNIDVPRIARNKRIYAGNVSNNEVRGSGIADIDWAIVTETLIELNRSVQVDGDLTITNLVGNEGDIVFVDENGLVGTLHQVWGEIPTGEINNANQIFTLGNTPVIGSVRVHLNGQRVFETTDYVIAEAVITMNNPPYADANYSDSIIVDYNYVTYSGVSSTQAGDVGYTAMTRGAACQSPGFDVKISRVRNMMTITGVFSTIVAPATGSIIASIDYSTVAQGYKLSTPAYGMAAAVDALDANRGVRFFVDTFDSNSSTIDIIVLNSRDNADVAFTLTFNLI